eukprot:SM000033S12374  [mRNA]  locus=s33:548322:551061:+ [translate_table: standard]
MSITQAGHILLQEPIKLGSILQPSPPTHFTSLTKVMCTLGQQSRSVEVIEDMLKAGMSVARFDFSQGDAAYHQETIDNLRKAVQNTGKICGVMLDTIGPELLVMNKAADKPIDLAAGAVVRFTPDLSQAASTEVLPVNATGLAQSAKIGTTIFVGQYLFTGSEKSSVWFEVLEIQGDDVICRAKNSTTLAGALITVFAAGVHMDLPTLSEQDKDVIFSWGAQNCIDFLSLSFTRNAEDVKIARNALKDNPLLASTLIFAKIESAEGLAKFDEILEEADGIILGRGNLGIDVPPEKVVSLQKMALTKCCMVGKPGIITRVVDTMTDTPRPTRAEATDVANAVLDGADGIMLGAETLRGLYPVEAVATVVRICSEAEKVYNHGQHFKKVLKFVGEPMTHLESIASSAVRAAAKVLASVVIVFSYSTRTARLIAKYRPSMPVIVVVIPRLVTNQLSWTLLGQTQARQVNANRGLFPLLADPKVQAPGSTHSNESILKGAIMHCRSVGIVQPNDRVVVCQRLGGHQVIKIVELSG